MLADGEPNYKRPRRLCIGISRDQGKPIYSEGFGEWKLERFTFLNEDSDGSLPDNGFEVTFSEETFFRWAWNWNEVHAELQMAEERARSHEEALLHDREEEEHLQYLIASCESAFGDLSPSSTSFELPRLPRPVASVLRPSARPCVHSAARAGTAARALPISSRALGDESAQGTRAREINYSRFKAHFLPSVSQSIIPSNLKSCQYNASHGILTSAT